MYQFYHTTYMQIKIFSEIVYSAKTTQPLPMFLIPRKIYFKEFSITPGQPKLYQPEGGGSASISLPLCNQQVVLNTLEKLPCQCIIQTTTNISATTIYIYIFFFTTSENDLLQKQYLLHTHHLIQTITFQLIIPSPLIISTLFTPSIYNTTYLIQKLLLLVIKYKVVYFPCNQVGLISTMTNYKVSPPTKSLINLSFQPMHSKDILLFAKFPCQYKK